MNFDLKSDKLNYMKPVFRRRFVREETVEVIVPDAQPDILRILDTDGMAFLRSKDSNAGRVSVTGVAELTVLYVPESGSGVRKLSVNMPFSASAEGADITSELLITAKLSIASADARTVNPRKVVVRTEIVCEAALYLPQSVYNTSPRDREDVYFKTDSKSLRLPAAVNEKTFIFTDEAHLPAGAADIGEILRSSTTLWVESVKAVGSKAVLKGSAQTGVLYESRDGRMCRETVSTPFSQIVDMDASGELVDFDVRLCLTGVYVSQNHMDGAETDALTIEIHAVAQCVAYADMTADIVADAYSSKFRLSAVSARCEFECVDSRETRSTAVSCSVPVAGRAGDVLDVLVRQGPASVQQGADGKVCAASMGVTVIYRDAGGEILSASKRIDFEQELGTSSDDAEVSVKPAGDIFTSLADGAIEVRIPLEMTVTGINYLSFDRIESVELDEDSPLDVSELPSLTVTRAGRGRDLWELAKSHMSTIPLIREVNGLADDAEPEEGRVLLIPRKQ